ncbi:MAG: hypothetical protein KUG68_06630 [Flavobacteriaceae bacterium]|nr:hypothetical protein [Flavobacteriaceae bacterium]
MSSIQGMIASLKNNNRRKNRDSVFAKDKNQTKSSFGEFVDHKQMNTYEYLHFRRKFLKKKEGRRKEPKSLL